MDRDDLFEAIYINDGWYDVKKTTYQKILDELSPKYIGQPNTEETRCKLKCDIHEKLLHLINIGEMLPTRMRYLVKIEED